MAFVVVIQLSMVEEQEQEQEVDKCIMTFVCFLHVRLLVGVMRALLPTGFRNNKTTRGQSSHIFCGN